MRRGQSHGGSAEPNAYTYSALLKAMGDQVCLSLVSHYQPDATILAAAAMLFAHEGNVSTASPGRWCAVTLRARASQVLRVSY